MAYCRFSSDDFKCDVYSYQSREGFVTHVAARRVITPITLVDYSSIDRTVETMVAQLKDLETAERAPIGLAHDGKSFIDGSLEELFERLTYLRGLGYNVPNSALEEIVEEMGAEEVGKP